MRHYLPSTHAALRINVMEILCLFELDTTTGEANGTVMPFCSEACRSVVATTTHAPWRKGVSQHSDFGYTPHCEECLKPLDKG